MFARIEEAIRPFKKAAMFELAEQGYASPFEQLVACVISIRTLDEVSAPTARTLFDVARTPNKHVGFGVGPHQCLGMNLARIELESALRALLTRFPRLRLDPERLPARKIESLMFRGFARLPVRAD